MLFALLLLNKARIEELDILDASTTLAPVSPGVDIFKQEYLLALLNQFTPFFAVAIKNKIFKVLHTTFCYQLSVKNVLLIKITKQRTYVNK